MLCAGIWGQVCKGIVGNQPTVSLGQKIKKATSHKLQAASHKQQAA